MKRVFEKLIENWLKDVCPVLPSAPRQFNGPDPRRESVPAF